MENLLQGIPNVVIYLEDILITGKTESEHLSTLAKALTKLNKPGYKHETKCKFMAKSVVFLGHGIDEQGIRHVKRRSMPYKKPQYRRKCHS